MAMGVIDEEADLVLRGVGVQVAQHDDRGGHAGVQATSSGVLPPMAAVVSVPPPVSVAHISSSFTLAVAVSVSPFISSPAAPISLLWGHMMSHEAMQATPFVVRSGLYVFIARFVPLAPVIPIVSIPIVMLVVMIPRRRPSLLTARSVALMFAPPIHSFLSF